MSPPLFRPRAAVSGICALTLLGSLLFAPGLPARAGEGEPAAIEVLQARTHPNAGVPVGVVYLQLHNRANHDDRLLRVETKAAKRAELHESVAEGDRVRMRHHPEGFPVAAGGELLLQPGGKHVMLMQLAQDLEVGGSIEITLVFERAGRLDVHVPVQPRAL